MINRILGVIALLLVLTLNASAADNFVIGESEALNNCLVSAPYRANTLVNIRQGENAWGHFIQVDHWKQQGTNRVFKQDQFMTPTSGALISDLRWKFDPTSGVLQISPVGETEGWVNDRVYPLHSPILGTKILRFRVFGSETIVNIDRRHDLFPEIFNWWEENIADARQGQSILIDIGEPSQGTIHLGGSTDLLAVLLQVSVNDFRPGQQEIPYNPFVVNDY